MRRRRQQSSLGAGGGWVRSGKVPGAGQGAEMLGEGGWRVLEASPEGRFPHLWVVAAGLSGPWNQLRAPSFWSLQFSLGTLYLEAASPGSLSEQSWEGLR